MYEVTAGISGDGHRVECTVRLPVPPAVVFDAVATGEGISSWFVPCALEPHVGGRVIQFADPGAPDPTDGPEAAAEASLTATVGEITELDPAAGRFAYVERDWMGPEIPVPPWETSFTVRPVGDDGTEQTELILRSGFDVGGALVREALDAGVEGWRHALHVLAHRLTHRPADGVVTVLAATEPVALDPVALWERVAGRLTPPADDGTARERIDSVGDVARAGEVGGVVVAASEAAFTVALSAPVDGVLELFAFPSGADAEDAAAHSALGARVYEYVDVPAGSGTGSRTGEPLGAAAVDGVAPTWEADHWRRWLGELVR